MPASTYDIIARMYGRRYAPRAGALNRAKHHDLRLAREARATRTPGAKIITIPAGGRMPTGRQ